MQQLFRMRDADGNDYDVPNSDMAEFSGAVPNAANVTRYRDAEGNDYDVPDADKAEFSAAVPNAQPLRRVSFANGTTRDFTMPEMAKFLRSKEWRESDDYKADREERDRAVNAKLGEDGEMHSPAWAGVKGALKGAVQGAWEGGNAAANKIVKAIPEIGNSLESALGNTINLFGNAPNALGNWFLADSASGKAWLDANFPSETKEWTGYEDWSTKTADKFADVSAMAYKFAPAMATGGSTALVNTMFASDGINAASQTFDNAIENGFTMGEANAAAAASFLVNFYGAKLMTKAGGVAGDVANPLLRFFGEAGAVGAAMGAQGVGNKGIENVVNGRPITEGMGDAFAEGEVEGFMFHGINAIPGAVMTGWSAAERRIRETRELKEYRRDSLLEVARGEGGGELLNTLLPGEGLDAAVRARKNGEDVSRKIGERAGLPDNMSVAERNEIIDAIARARGERAAQNAVKIDGFRADALNEAIKGVVGGEEYADAIRAEVLSNIKSARELDNPVRRMELVEEAAQKVSAPDEQARAAAEHRAKSMAGMEERARRKADMAEYEKQEAERKAREEAEQNAPRITVSDLPAETPAAPAEKPSAPAETGRGQFPEYYEWLDKTGKKDSDKNWRKFVAENDLDPALAGKRPEPPAEKPAVKPDGKGKMVPVEPEAPVEEAKKPEVAAEPPQEPVETRPVAETGKETPEPAKPVEPPSRASDAKPAGKNLADAIERDLTARRAEKWDEADAARDTWDDLAQKVSLDELRSVHADLKTRLAENPKDLPLVGAESRLRHALETREKAESPKPDGKGRMVKREKKPINATPVEDTKFGQSVVDGAHFLNEGYKSRQNVSAMDAHRKNLADSMSKASDHDLQTVIEVAKSERGRQYSKKKNIDGKTIENNKWRAWEDVRTLAENELAKRANTKSAQPHAEAPKPDGKGKMVKPKTSESVGTESKQDYGITMSEEPSVDGDGVRYVVKDGPGDAHRMMFNSKAEAEARLGELRAERKAIQESPSATLSDGKKVRLLKTDEGWVPYDENYNDLRHGMFKAAKTKAEAVEVAEKGVKWARDVAEENARLKAEAAKPKPDGKGKMVKPKAENPTPPAEPPKPDGEGKMVKPATRAPIDTTPLSDAIAEAKSLAKKNRAKVFEVKTGTTTVKFSSGIPESIARAEKLLKKLQKPTDWTKKPTESSVPKPPSLTVATGKKIGGFNDVSKDFVAKDDTRKVLKTPIVQNGKIYATDGRAIIRMDSPSGAKNTKGAPNCEELFVAAKRENVNAAFTLDVQKAHVALEQARVIPQDNKPAVEMWLSPDGEVMFRSRNNANSPTEPSDNAAFTGKSLHGAQLINHFDPAYLSKAFKAFAKLGDGTVNAELRGDLLYLKGKNADALVMPMRGGDFSTDALSLLMGGKTNLTAAEANKVIEGNPKLKDALDKNPAGLDPLYSRAPDGEIPTSEPKNKKAKLQRIEPIASEPTKSPEQEIAERLDLKRLDPKRRSDPKVLAWAKKNGRNVTNGMATPDAVRAYDESMTEATAKRARRWFPDMKIVAHKFGETIKRGVHVIDLRDTSGGVLGWFDPKSKEIHLLPGADPQTVAHEIMWHGTRQYMTDLAAKGDARAQKFLDMMHDVEQNAPQAIKDLVNRIYARGGKAISRDTLLNEYGAWFTMGKGGEALEKALQKAENRNWFARGLHTVKEMVKDFLSAHGRNRVDLAAIDGMTRDEFVDFLAKEFSSGKTLGNIKGKQPPTLSTKETALQRYKRRFYDQNAAVRDLERDIEKKTGKKISADDSVEAANALKYGLKEAANIETQGEKREFIKVLSETGIHYEDFEYYAALKAAAGRDAKIDARNIAKLTADLRSQGASAQDIADAVANYKSSNGSHIDPREAKMMLNEIENGPDAAKFKKTYDAIRPIIDATLDTQVKAGLVGATEAAQWRTEEPYYIPFKNEYDAETGEWAGRGMSRNYAKPEHYTAKGRQSAAGDILAHIFMDHQAAKLRAIENGVRQKLANLVRANPELGKVEVLGDNEKTIENTKPNVVVFKDGGRAYKITLEGTRGEAIANAFTQRNQLKMGWADRKFMGVSMRGFARATAGMATRYSPTFAVRNTTKDNIELANIVYSERGPIEGSKFMGRYIASRAQMAGTLAKYITTGKIDATTAHGKILDRYIKAGGLIAGGTRAEAFDSIKKSLTPEAIAKEMRRGNSKTRAVAKHVLNSIGYLNEYAEMATRVGIFDAEIKAGKSDAEAALFARRATVDFNRHGDWTPAFNMFRLFSNSTLGASARAAAALTKSKYGAAAMGALFVNGLARAFIDHFVNADEDERRRKTGEATGKDISEYERRTSLFYFRNGDKLYKVAEHESPFSLVSYAGDCVGRWICGDLDGKQVAKNLGVTTAEVAYNFLPMGSINLTAQNGGFAEDAKSALISGVVPTAAQPIAELWANVDYAGRTIYNDPGHDNKTPRAEQGRDSTPDWAKEAAVKLNESTRSEGSRKGYVDIPPEAIQKLVEGYGKNALRDVSMAVSIGEAIIKGDFSKLDPRNEPVKRDFVRPLDGNDKRFGAARKEFEDNMDYFKKTEMTEDERVDYLAKFPHIRGKRGSDLLAAIKKFRKMERGFAYKNGKAIPHEWPQEKLDEFKEKRRALQAQFLELMGDK